MHVIHQHNRKTSVHYILVPLQFEDCHNYETIRLFNCQIRINDDMFGDIQTFISRERVKIRDSVELFNQLKTLHLILPKQISVLALGKRAKRPEKGGKVGQRQIKQLPI